MSAHVLHASVLREAKRRSLNVEGPNSVGGYWIKAGGHVISWFFHEGRSGHVSCLHVQRENERSDPQSDYFPGSFAPTLKAAFRWACADATKAGAS